MFVKNLKKHSVRDKNNPLARSHVRIHISHTPRNYIQYAALGAVKNYRYHLSVSMKHNGSAKFGWGWQMRGGPLGGGYREALFHIEDTVKKRKVRLTLELS